MNGLTGAAIGAVIGLGLYLTAIAWTGDLRLERLGNGGTTERVMMRIGLALGATTLGYLITGWLAAALMLGFAAYLAPSQVGRKASRAAGIARTEALASWAEMLRDTMAAAAGLQEAVIAAAKVAPPSIRTEARALAARIERQPFSDALAMFAAEVNDPVADLLVVALSTAADRQAGQLGEVLSAAATTARASATMRLRVEAGRARTYTSVRVTVIVFCTVAGGLIVFNRRYLTPFDTAAGQVMLLIIGGLFGAGLWTLSRLGDAAAPERLFRHETMRVD